MKKEELPRIVFRVEVYNPTTDKRTRFTCDTMSEADETFEAMEFIGLEVAILVDVTGDTGEYAVMEVEITKTENFEYSLPF